jgi:hypothetical protein
LQHHEKVGGVLHNAEKTLDPNTVTEAVELSSYEHIIENAKNGARTSI